LTSNSLTSLPNDIFANLTQLVNLNLDDNCLDCPLVKQTYPIAVCNESDQKSCPYGSGSESSKKPSSAIQVNMEMLVLVLAMFIALII